MSVQVYNRLRRCSPRFFAWLAPRRTSDVYRFRELQPDLSLIVAFCTRSENGTDTCHSGQAWFFSPTFGNGDDATIFKCVRYRRNERHGLEIFYYSNGKRWCERRWRTGMLCGWWQEWSLDGHPSLIMRFDREGQPVLQSCYVLPLEHRAPDVAEVEESVTLLQLLPLCHVFPHLSDADDRATGSPQNHYETAWFQFVCSAVMTGPGWPQAVHRSELQATLLLHGFHRVPDHAVGTRNSLVVL